MKKFLFIVFISLLITGCGFGGGGGFTQLPEITNTSQQGLQLMDQDLFDSKNKVWDGFVVLELQTDIIAGFPGNNNKYLSWLEAGICYEGDDYACDSGDDAIKDSRLDLYYGNVALTGVTKINGTSNALNFYKNYKMVKSITLVSLEQDASGAKLEKNFRKAIVSNVSYKQLELGKIKYFKSLGKKEIVIKDLVSVIKNGESYYEYETLLDLIENKENFILLITSNRAFLGNQYLFFGDEEDDINNKETVPTQICEKSSGFFGFSGNYCDSYVKSLNKIAYENGFKYYHINVNTNIKQTAVERHVLLVGSPSINVFVGGIEQKIIVGPVNQKYIENELFKVGIIDKNFHFLISCDLESDETCTYSKEGVMESLKISSEDYQSTFNLLYSDLLDAKYFISTEHITDISTSNFDTHYLNASEINGFKQTFEVGEEEPIFTKLIDVNFEAAGTYYVYVYSKDVRENEGIRTFKVEVEENLLEQEG